MTTFKGQVIDATTGNPIAAATLQVTDMNGNPTGQGAVADGSGNFTLNVSSPSTSWVTATCIGYNTVSEIPADTTDLDLITMFPSTSSLAGVTVTGTSIPTTTAITTTTTPTSTAAMATVPGTTAAATTQPSFLDKYKYYLLAAAFAGVLIVVLSHKPTAAAPAAAA